MPKFENRVASFEEISIIHKGETLPEKLWEIPELLENINFISDPEAFKISIDEEYDNTYLGILQLDVDSLGELFIMGFPPTEQSFSLQSSLSYWLNWFFSGFLNTLSTSTELYRQHLFILYSGGDDVFVIGRWDVVVDFLSKLQAYFHRLTCKREDITFSAGLTFIKHKYPISRAAELTKELEDLGKKYKYKNYRKGAIALFDVAISWNPKIINEWKWVTQKAKWLYEGIKNKYIGTGFLHRLNNYYVEMLRKYGTTLNHSYLERPEDYVNFFYKISYDVARRMPENLNKPYNRKKKEFLEQLLELYWSGDTVNCISNPRSFVLLSIAVQLTLLLDRTYKKNINENE